MTLITLDSLPDELAGLIVDCLSDDRATLLNVAVTSSRFQDLAESVLWRRLFIREGQQCKRLLQSLRVRRARATAIHEIELRGTSRHEVGLQKFHKILALTHNLRELIVQSPTCKQRMWSKDGNWPVIKQDIESLLQCSGSNALRPNNATRPPLQLLKRLTIHSAGEKARYWSSNSAFRGLFLHPCLEELTISCANIDLSQGTVIHSKHATPLKRLTFVECNINSVGLTVVLSLPRALEHLYLGENRDNRKERSPPACNNLLSDEEDQFFDALKRQAHSLKTFVYRPSRPQSLTAFSGSHSFSSFEALESVSILGKLGTSDQLESTLLSTSPNLQTLVLALDLDRHAARTFLSLAMETDAESISNSPLFKLAKRAILSSTLRDVRIVGSSYRPPSDFHSPHMIAVMERFMEIVRNRNIHLTINYEIRREWTPIHPILYHVQEPIQHVIFDSANDGWVANINGIAIIGEDERRRLEVMELMEEEDEFMEESSDLD